MNRIIGAFKNSFAGFVAAFKSEPAFRQDVAICAIGFVAIAVMKLGYMEKLALGSSLIVILLMESVNTAIEATIDRISNERHPLAKKAKDIGSLLVLVSFLQAGAIWATILAANFL